MILFDGTVREFDDLIASNELVPRLREAWLLERGSPARSNEIRSWQNSLPRLAGVCRLAGLRDQQLMLEYRLPRTGRRMDAFLLGASDSGDRGFIIELKQWETTQPSDGEFVVTWVGGTNKPTLHPSIQAYDYQRFFEQGCEGFDPDAWPLRSAVFLHNYQLAGTDALLDPKFAEAVRLAPIFDEGGARALATTLAAWIPKAPGAAILQAARDPRLRPSKKLMECVGKAATGHEAFVLLDNQKVALSEILAAAKRATHLSKGTAVIVSGGPGTGKSAVAVQALGQLAKKHLKVNLSFGNAALHKAISRHMPAEARAAITKFWNYRGATELEMDVLLCDEAHRIRSDSNMQWVSQEERSPLAQIDELFNVARVVVFFIDDLQTVRRDDVGSRDLIRSTAAKRGLDVVEVALEAQFRCSGNDAYLSWITDVLGLEETAHPYWIPSSGFEFELVDSPEELRARINEKAQAGASARLMAGYCWPWTDQQTPDGGLVADVKIGQFEMPWNARDNFTKLPKGVPKSIDWATQPGGIDQIGCIYTAQGFEFDYAGVIWGPDLVARGGRLKGDVKGSKDSKAKSAKEDFDRFVRQTYRVLLSRGMKGCYVHITDPETREYVRSRLRAPDVVSGE